MYRPSTGPADGRSPSGEAPGGPAAANGAATATCASAAERGAAVRDSGIARTAARCRRATGGLRHGAMPRRWERSTEPSRPTWRRRAPRRRCRLRLRPGRSVAWRAQAPCRRTDLKSAALIGASSAWPGGRRSMGQLSRSRRCRTTRSSATRLTLGARTVVTRACWRHPDCRGRPSRMGRRQARGR